MQTPYEILNVANDASDKEIKQAYLQHVKNNPPDRHQEKFQRIHTAYLAIKNHQSRVSYDLFTLPKVQFDDLLDHAFKAQGSLIFTPKLFKGILDSSAKSANLKNIFTEPKRS